MIGRLGLVTLMSAVLCLMFTATDTASNCWINDDCDGAPLGYSRNLLDFVTFNFTRVCCPFHTSLFYNAGSFPRPWCRCDFSLMKTTTCWKGEQCCGCGTDIGIQGDMPVCCSECRSKQIDDGFGGTITRLKFSNVSCTC